MTKKDIVEIVAETAKNNLHINRSHIKDIVDCVFDTFIDILAQDGRFEIRDFGVFSVKKTPARIGRNPLTKEEAVIPARNIIQFKVGKKMKEEVEKAGFLV